MTAAAKSEPIQWLRITNERQGPMEFVLEPWGEFWPMPPGAVFEVQLAASDHADMPEAVISDKQVKLFVGRAIWAAVYHEGQEISHARTNF